MPNRIPTISFRARCSYALPIWAFVWALAWGACSESGEPPPSTNWGSDIPTLSMQNHHGGDSSNRAPVLKRVGDRQLVVGEAFSLSLEALDPDDDPLSFAVFGDLPPSAKFDKLEGRLDWTPSSIVAPFYLTFQVSDGSDIDRETARFSTTMMRENEAPEFVKLGDQTVIPGAQLGIALEATDPNSDTLLFEIDGEAPDGAELDSSTGLFSWNIPVALVGKTIRVGFRVTDGSLSDSMEIKFIVSDGVGAPSPPEFLPIGPFDAAIESPLTFKVQAIDPDGQIIKYGIDGEAPFGAVFDEVTGVFTWTPPSGTSGSSVLVVFSATDGTFVSYQEVNIFVFLPGPVESCLDDAFEPNNDSFAAMPLAPGVYEGLSICDSQVSPVDVDWFSVVASAGENVEGTLTWDPAGKDMSVSIATFWPGDFSVTYVAGSMGEKGNLSASYTALGGELVYVAVFGEEPVKYAESYTLNVTVDSPTSLCIDDPFDAEPGNDTFDTAIQLGLEGNAANLSNLYMCPSDPDWFTIYLTCGSSLEVSASSDMNVLDVDLFVYKADAPEFTLKSGLSLNNPEKVTLDPVPATGDYRIKAEAYPKTASGEYSLDIWVDPEANCIDDADEPNDSTAQATVLTPNTGQLDRKICCSSDYYALQLSEGEKLTTQLAFSSGTGSLQLIRGADLQQVANQSGANIDTTWEADVTGLVYLHVSSAMVGQPYTLNTTVEQPSVGCDSLSCPAFEVCDPVGDCVSDFCHEDTPCPAGLTCIDTYCVDPCFSDSDCRTELDYHCKAFPEGRFCGLSGDHALGESCYWFSNCEGNFACLLKDNGGYCAAGLCISDMDCGFGSSCTMIEGTYMCGKTCFLDTECRVDDGYACHATPNISLGVSSVCAPNP